jgi:hypothetical protein
VYRRTWTADDGCGNTTTRSQTITVIDITAPLINCPEDIVVCSADLVGTLTVPTATDNCAGTNVVVTWTRSDGATNLNAPWPSGTTTVISTATDGCNTSTCTNTVTVDTCIQYCTLSQGWYGNEGGKGKQTVAIMSQLLATNDLVIGKPGNSVTFTLDDIKCIILRLPATGPSSVLPGGNLVMDTNCNTTTPLPLDKKGIKFRNNMLGQTITLSMNIRLYQLGNGDSPLGEAPLTSEFCTWDGEHGDSINSFTISANVLTALTNLGLPHTVGGLVELANRALADWDIAPASLGDVHGAVGTIIDAFHGCRFLTSDCSKD